MTADAYEAEPSDVAAVVAGELGDITDPLERYHRAGAAQALHAAVSDAFALERASAVLAMHEEGGLSFQDIADVTLIGTKGRVQQLVEKARGAGRRRSVTG